MAIQQNLYILIVGIEREDKLGKDSVYICSLDQWAWFFKDVFPLFITNLKPVRYTGYNEFKF